MRHLVFAALSLAAAYAFAFSKAHAEHLIAVSWTGAIYRFDDPLGEPRLLQQTDYRFGGLARDPTGKLLAIAESEWYGYPLLLTIDPQSGTPTPQTILIPPLEEDRRNLYAITCSDDGTLYGVYATPGRGSWSVELVSVSAGGFGMNHVADLNMRVSGLATAPDGTIVANTVQDLGRPNGGIAILDPTDGTLTDLFRDDVSDFQTLAFNSEGRLFVGWNFVAEYDLLTGEIRDSNSSMRLDIRGMEFVVPEPASFLIGGSAALSLAALRRRK